MHALTDLSRRSSRTGRMWVPVLAAAFSGALLYFAVSVGEVFKLETEQRHQLIKMAESFVTVFGEDRVEGALIPATLRRRGLEHFTQQNSGPNEGVRTSVSIPGRPGLEILTITQDPEVRQIIKDFIRDPATPFANEHFIRDGRLIGRSIYPSVARSTSCVECHNQMLGEDIYKPGDLMGAFVVESDLTVEIWRKFTYAIIAFFIGLLSFGLLALREHLRMRDVVQGLRASVKLEKEKAEAESYAKFLMSHDPLTKLANRSMLSERLEANLKAGSGDGVIIALVDLDEFKQVNDTLGHAAGDALLVEVAERLARLTDDVDALVARLGGDEFAVVIEPSPICPTATFVGDAIIKAMHLPFQYEDAVVRPACSVGVAQAGTISQPTATKLMKAADAALYTAKRDGKNGFRVFDDQIQASLSRRAELKSRLGAAIESGQLRAVLQPKIDLVSRATIGFEALARLTLDGEEVSPVEFIPIAEEAGVVGDIDLSILRQAASFATNEEQRTGYPIEVSVNLSAMNFQSPELAGTILDILNDVGLNPARLTLEVTESTAVQAWDIVQAVLGKLRKVGVRASLDDFGTGYSSLSYLRRFGFEEIKIDRSFINGITHDKETRFLFESIVSMAQGLGSEVVVEGIETEEQAHTVLKKGAMIGQGFLFSKPLEIEDARMFLTNSGWHAA